MVPEEVLGWSASSMFALKDTWKTVLRPLSLIRLERKEDSWAGKPLYDLDQREGDGGNKHLHTMTLWL